MTGKIELYETTVFELENNTLLQHNILSSTSTERTVMHLLQFFYSHILPLCAFVAVCGFIPCSIPYFGFILLIDDFIEDIRYFNLRECLHIKRYSYRMGWSSLATDLICLMVGVCAILTIILLILGKMYHLTI